MNTSRDFGGSPTGSSGDSGGVFLHEEAVGRGEWGTEGGLGEVRHYVQVEGWADRGVEERAESGRETLLESRYAEGEAGWGEPLGNDARWGASRDENEGRRGGSGGREKAKPQIIGPGPGEGLRPIWEETYWEGGDEYVREVGASIRRGSTRRAGRAVWRAASRLAWFGAAILIAIGVWQAVGTDLYARFTQWSLGQEIQAIVVEAMGGENPTIVAGVRGGGTAPAEVARAVPGEYFGKIVIPAIGVDQNMVVGVGVAELKKGPGWVMGSAYAGREGNMVISGHRTTYGGPFGRLDELKAGDRIEIWAGGVAGGVAIYEVRASYIVTPEDTWVADPTPGARITLTTCHPRGSSRQRLIIQGELVAGGDVEKALSPGEWEASAPRQ